MKKDLLRSKSPVQNWMILSLILNLIPELDDEASLNLKHEDLINEMNEHCQMWKRQRWSPLVHIICAPSKLHYDWDTYFDRLYKRPATGAINKNHIFRADNSQYALLTTERVKGVDVKKQNLNKLKPTSTGATKADRTKILKYGKVEVIKTPGLKPIKQFELYKKWQPLVPKEFADKICPKPPNSVLEIVKNERVEKQKANKAPKKKATKRKSKK